jgi:hypothetical protein
MNPTETQAREEICRVGRSLFERGYFHATPAAAMAILEVNHESTRCPVLPPTSR